jgi:hypothetical protein
LTSWGLSVASASAERATRSKPATCSSGDGAAEASTASKSYCAGDRSRWRERRTAIASCFTTVLSHAGARSGSSLEACFRKISSPRW